VLEFGSGGSTVFWAKNCKSVKSYETSPEWLDKVKTRVRRYGNTEVLLLERNQALEKINSEPDNFYDIVLIDSYPKDIERIIIANASMSKLKKNGYLIIDNYQKFGMEKFIYPPWDVYTFDELRYSGRGTRICIKTS